MLVQNPDAVNAVNNDGKALLHLAALYDKIEICKVGDNKYIITMMLNQIFMYSNKILLAT